MPKMYKEITAAHTENKVIFYRIINKQRQTGRERLNELVVNGESYQNLTSLDRVGRITLRH